MVTLSGPIKKHCNCKNSRCLKLYCECFASGRYCDNCNCVNCCNNKESEQVRQAAVEAILERNPNAFRPKIQVWHPGTLSLYSIPPDLHSIPKRALLGTSGMLAGRGAAILPERSLPGGHSVHHPGRPVCAGVLGCILVLRQGCGVHE